ncbi:MAG: tryptophan synthase subunit alpha [Desulfobulbaceae bacterium]|nr:tryptophan synthase subunit alpha [Desulfobulbaceae bacterium]
MNNLEADLRDRLNKKPILLMTHLVLGYPSLDTNYEVIRQMAENGVDCIEMQIPFSEPMADGPIIVAANQKSLSKGITVEDSFQFAERVIKEFPQVNFLFMTYYNIVFRYGEERFIKRSTDIGIKGFIVPDLPPEEGETYIRISKEHGMAPIQFFTPTSSDERMREVAAIGGGFIYCVARRGVTGTKLELDTDLVQYLQRCRAATELPLAVGFGISSREDIQMLTGKVEMAVIGTATIRLVDEKGADKVASFMKKLQ